MSKIVPFLLLIPALLLLIGCPVKFTDICRITPQTLITSQAFLLGCSYSVGFSPCGAAQNGICYFFLVVCGIVAKVIYNFWIA
jgi:hypothetical protein